MSTSPVLWYVSRATGVVTLVLFTAVMLLGILVNRQGRLPGLPRFAVTGLHRNLSLLSVTFLLVHIVTAVIDPYVTIGWLAVLVPLTSPYEPLAVGLGAVALDLALAVVLTSLLRLRMPPGTWKAVHWLAYACWPVAVLHGVSAAPDLRSGVLLLLTLACVLAVAGALAYRWTRQPALPTRDRARARLSELTAGRHR